MARVQRYRREHSRAQASREVAFATTDLDAHQVTAAGLAAHARGHWTVANRAHHVRD